MNTHAHHQYVHKHVHEAGEKLDRPADRSRFLAKFLVEARRLPQQQQQRKRNARTMAAQLLKERTSCRSGEERQNKDVRPGPRGDQNGWRKPAAAGEPRHAAAARGQCVRGAATTTATATGLQVSAGSISRRGAAGDQQGTPQSSAPVHAPARDATSNHT